MLIQEFLRSGGTIEDLLAKYAIKAKRHREMRRGQMKTPREFFLSMHIDRLGELLGLRGEPIEIGAE